MIIEIVRLFVTYAVNLWLLESWMSEQYKPVVNKKLNAVTLVFFGCIGVLFHFCFYRRLGIAIIRFITGLTIQFVFAHIIYDCKSFKKVASFVLFVTLACLGDSTLYVIST